MACVYISPLNQGQGQGRCVSFCLHVEVPICFLVSLPVCCPFETQLVAVGILHQISSPGTWLRFISCPPNSRSLRWRTSKSLGFSRALREKADFSTHFLVIILISLRFRALQISYFCASSITHLNRFKNKLLQPFSGFTQEGLSRESDLH